MSTIQPGKALVLASLLTPTEHGIASRVLAKTPAGSVSLFAFDAGEALGEHTTPFDALALVLEGEVTLTVGGTAVQATAGTITRMPGGVPHAVDAVSPSRLLLIMLRERPSG
jgi:quercetin dioxygenase-like cupin family protein